MYKNLKRASGGIIFMLIVSFFFYSCTFNLINIDPFGAVKTKKDKTKIVKDTVLHFKLSGDIEIYEPDSGMDFSFFGGKATTIHDLILKINSAKTDSRIKAILLEPSGISSSFSSLGELQVALKGFKASGKKIYGYFDVASDDDIFLLSVADEVYMNPSASARIVLMGVGGNMYYFKDLLDKVGAEFHVVKAGDYKGAGEGFTRTSMSDEVRSNYTQLYSDRYSQLIANLATGYNIAPASVRSLFEERETFTIEQENSITSGFVDELMGFDAMCAKLNITKERLVPHSKYTPTPVKKQDKQIAVVYMIGNITESSGRSLFGSSMDITSAQYNKIFDDIMEDKNISAVVLRISSGGGSALVSDILYHKIAQLQEKKKVIVSMGSVAASGGYYIAAGANYIYADPYTVTGSIGVIGMILNLEGSAKKVGISSDGVGYGKYRNSMDPIQPFDPVFADAWQVSVDAVYNEFKQRVAQGRKLTMERVEAIAQGQVWSAQKALEYKLIDEIGLLGNAIEKAAQLSNTRNYSLAYYPKKDDRSITSGFEIGIRQQIMTGALPYPLNTKTHEYLKLIEDIHRDPIQMRTELLWSEGQ